MPRLRLFVAFAVLIASFAAMPAQGGELPENCRNLETDPDLPERIICTERTYFHCGQHKVANLDNLNSATTWDKTAPTKSVQDGAGCGALDTFLTGSADHNPIYDAPFAGVYEGRIDAITLHAHVIDAGLARATNDFRFRMHLEIDGETIVPRTAPVLKVTPVASGSGASREIVVSVTDIGLTGLEDDGEHDVKVTLYSPFVDTNTANGWVWDTTEVPSGILFNPLTTAPAKYVRS